MVLHQLRSGAHLQGQRHRAFKAHSGISGDRLVGIGDTSSDLAIREQVAYFCCPANAIDEVKAVADFVASRPEAEGVIEILEHLMSV